MASLNESFSFLFSHNPMCHRIITHLQFITICMCIKRLHLLFPLDRGVAVSAVSSENGMERHLSSLCSVLKGLVYPEKSVLWLIDFTLKFRVGVQRLNSSILWVKWQEMNPFMQEITALKLPDYVGESVRQRTWSYQPHETKIKLNSDMELEQDHHADHK